MTTRRQVLGAAVTAPFLSMACAGRVLAQSGMNILILGGTGFIGPHLVQHAMDRGHKITLFNRGRSNPGLFPAAEKLVGDRDGDLTALRGRHWDAVIDNSGYTPEQVQSSLTYLHDACDLYLFTSTRAVYHEFTAERMDENAPLGPRDIPESRWEGYGPGKVLAERVVMDGFGARAIITRPSIIVGPGDRTDRFTYWVDRIDDGGDILVQGEPADPVQFIDVRDLGEFYVHLLEHAVTGIYNTVGLGAPLGAAELVDGIKAVTATPSRFHWVDWDFLIKEGETPQGSLPFWQPPRGQYLNYGRMDSRRAIDKGLTFRPLAVTARDTLEWHRTRTTAEQAGLKAGLSRAREAELLRKWNAAA